jgi:hypothetical protein
MSTISITRRFAFALGFGAGFASIAGAQTVLYTQNGDQQYDRLGAAVANAGDFNNDGFDDFVAGAPQDFMVFFEGTGFARVYSGADGSVLGTFTGDVVADAFGDAVDGAGDVNNDGYDDIVVGAPFSSVGGTMRGMVRVISGQTGSVLYTMDGAANSDQMGSAVSAAGDVNGDGYDDFIGGAQNANSTWGMVRVYSGATGAVLHQLDGAVSGVRLGTSVSDLGDVNGDNKDDFIVGSLFDGVYVISGANGSQIHHFNTAPSSDVYGRSVSSITDMNGDGKRDVLIGATQEDIFNPGTGYVEVRSSASGQVLLTFSGTAISHRFGYEVDDAGDYDGDGTPDIIVSSVPTSTDDAYATIHSGVDGSVLATLSGSPGDDLGFSVAGLGDVNGDGKADVACGAHLAAVTGLAAGQVIVYSSPFSSCGGTVNYCSTSVNSSGGPATITTAGSTSIATNLFILVANGCPSSQFGLFYYGQNQTQVVFGNGFRCVGGKIYRLGVTSTNGSGVATRTLDFNNMPNGGEIAPNSTWNFQYWFRDPPAGGAQFNLTDGVEVTFCP